jgi:metallo-beta-lactamase family protein
MKITFWGAARNVTGSKHLIESGGCKLLLDCGFYQGKRTDANRQNGFLPFDAKTVSAVILSHAHIDHCGTLPVLVKNGFTGKIYCTPATAEIAEYILLDSANIQKNDCDYYNTHAGGQEPISPIYGQEDVQKVVERFQTVDYFSTTGKWTDINEKIRFKFYDAGHILGAAAVSLGIKENNITKNLVFSGDLGRDELPILRAPETIQESAKTLIMECTYGNRVHQPMAKIYDKLKSVLRSAARKKSKIIVPAFSLGRTQELIYILNLLTRANEIPPLPIYVDTPLGDKITKIFPRYVDLFDSDFAEKFGNNGKAAFNFNNLKYVQSTAESKSLNGKNGPFIVIAGSGMSEGGRILHHLKNNIGDNANIVLITGYQAKDTLGRKILENISPVRIYDKFYDVRAKVMTLNELSAHADQNDLMDYAKNIKGLKNLFLVHAEMAQAEPFADLARKSFPEISVSIPEFSQSVEI